MLLAIFGYNDPKTDVEAVELLKDGWGDVNGLNLEEPDTGSGGHRCVLVKSWNARQLLGS